MIGNLLNFRLESMSANDTAWLRMEGPSNLMMITGVFMLEDPVDLETLRETVKENFLSFRRFRQRAVQDLRGAWWETDPDFDIRMHVVRVSPLLVVDLPELKQIASDLASTPLDFSRPLWRFDLVENFRGGSAVILRIHHCYADGIALVQVLLSMTTRSRNGVAKGHPGRRSRRDGGAFERLSRPARRLVRNSFRVGAEMWKGSIHMLREPEKALDLTRVGVAMLTELANAVLLADDPVTRFKGTLGPAKITAWAEPLPLDEIKAVGKVLGCTINDVLLSSVAGALRAYMMKKGDRVDGLEIRATVPVNLRPEGQALKLGNQFGLVFLTLPIGIANPFARLQAVRKNMEELKNSYQAQVSLGLLTVLGKFPGVVQQLAIDAFSNKATAVMTNVPGPREPLYFAGAEIDQIMFWVPQSGNIGMGVSILSYNGGVQFGLITDRKVVPDPEAIVSRFRHEFDKLLLAMLMEPRDRLRHPREVQRDIQGYAAAL